MTMEFSSTEPELREGEAKPLPLDPFGYWPEARSRIAGLGGGADAPDPGYAFHTPYFPHSPGPVVFHLSFEGLTGTTGELTVKVNELSDAPGAYAQTTLVRSLPFVALSRRGRATIAIEAAPGRSYAILGQLSEDAQASAVSLTIHAAEGTVPVCAKGVAAGAAFRSVGATPLLTSLDAATLEHPCSQRATVAQLAEPHAARLAPADAGDWPTIYALRCLEVASLLQPGARVLLVGSAAPLHQALEMAGAVILSPPTSPGTMPSNAADGAILVDPRADKSGADPLQRIEDALESLTPGGVAVCLLRYAEPGDHQSHAIDRSGVERLAMTLLSRHYDVAQLKFVPQDSAPASKRKLRSASTSIAEDPPWFGLLVRSNLPQTE